MAEPIKIQFRPGVNRETTDYGNTGGWYDCNLARIRTGTWSSMGGWTAFTQTPAQGTFRSLFPWATLNGSRYYATGTNLKYYIVRGNSLVDVTPIRSVVSPMSGNPFKPATGSKTVTVTDAGNGAVLNDFVTYSAVTGPIDGIPASDFNQEHQITGIIDDDHYTIVVATTATGNTAGGGSVAVADYQINTGLNTSAFGNGWGTGPWGSNGWGTGSDTFVQTDQLRLWEQDNYGEDLLFNVRNGGIYFKDMSNVELRAVELASLASSNNAPTIATQVLVSNNDRHIVAFGANDPVISDTQDPMNVRWASAESLIDWDESSTTNSAGSLRLSTGSTFVKAIETTTEILVFTDIALISWKYVGDPFIFGQTLVALNTELIGPNAVTSTGAITAWLGNGVRFQWYNGVATDMPCDIRTYVSDILNMAQTQKIVAGVNRQFSEFIWLMPVNGSSENNFYVICNFESVSKVDVRYGGALTWYYGHYNNLGRTTWIDAWFESTPLAGGTDGIIYQHDVGATDGSVQPPGKLESFIKSSVFELADGGNFMLVSRTIPDIDFDGSTTQNPSVNFTFQKRDYPGSPFVDGPTDPVEQTITMPIGQYTEKVDKRFRARSVQIGVEAVTTGTSWSLGVPRIYSSPDGQR